VDELLTQTVRLIQDTFGYYHVHIGLIEEDVVVLPAAAGVYEDEPDCAYCATLHLGLGQDTVCGQVAATGKPLLVADISQEPRYLHPMGATGSGVVVPLKVKDRVIGLLDVENRQTNAFDENNVAVLQLLASQIAVAIENARLYEQAQSLAALQERQKLARELHDSVSQALYGISLGTRTALGMLDGSGMDGTQVAALQQPLEYTMSLAKAGLAEMRALIFELRPESLEVEGLVAALTRQVDALSARHGIDVRTTFGLEPEIPVGAKETLYRVAQEALHNVIKHTDASQVGVSLLQHDGDVVLEIRDNGQGFDPQGHFPGHLGLQSMRERVDGSGGVLVVTSAPGEGTCVRAKVSIS
jgi:signal transduction histidine kinase